MAQLTLVVFFELGEVVRHSRLCDIHSCARCREVSQQGRNVGGSMPGRRITGGRRKVATMSYVFSSMQYIYFQNTLGSNMEAPNLFFAPGAM